MRIVHICESFIEGWGYQENLLPLYQKRAGHDVVIVSDNAHLRILANQPELRNQIIAQGSEYSYEGMKIYKIKTFLNTSSTAFFCFGLHKILEKERPDIIFHHNVGLATLSVAARYKRQHPNIKLYVDSHVDWINESKNRLWHFFFYDIVIPLQVWRLGKTIDYYFGVSPMRCQYLSKVFHVPEQKVRFFPIGCDTDEVEKVKDDRKQLRKKFHISEDAFVVVIGGKMDRTKGTLELIAACDEIRRKGENIKLMLFGKSDDEIKSNVDGKDWIVRLGWCYRITTLSLLKMADVACWPWLHTTLIEDSVAAGTPIIVKM